MLTPHEHIALAPQMQTYRQHHAVFAPYVNFKSEPNFRSDIVNTDANGFRVSYKADEQVDSTGWAGLERPGIVLGGSAAFGDGATQDRCTLASHLNALTSYAFVNLAVRGGNSTQELLAALPFVSRARCIVVFSGYNTLVANIQSVGINDLYGPFFFEEHFEPLSEHSIAQLPTLVERPLDRYRARTLAAELLRRVARRVTRRLGRAPQPLRSQRRWESRFVAWTYSDADLARGADQALAFQLRDLRLLAEARPAGAELVFAAQPFAPGLRRSRSEEEEVLLTAGPADLRKTFEERMLKVWPGYIDRVREWCGREGLRFVDLNRTELSGWCFVDSVHMTDGGYAQVARAVAAALA